MNKPLSPYRCGADNGLWFGLYLSALYAALLSPGMLASLLSIAMMAGVPVVVWTLIRRDRLAPGGFHAMGLLWLDGLMTMFCGALIASALLFVFLRWISPDYIADSFATAIATLEASPDASAQQMADDIRQALECGLSFTPGVFVFSMLWVVVSSGAILSLVLAALMAHRYPAPPTTSSTNL